jgi:hypothetical protein
MRVARSGSIAAVLLTFTIWLALPEYTVAGQKRGDDRLVLHAAKTEKAPQIDGDLESEIWEHAQVAGRFIQKQPHEGIPATERTEAKILYDSANLYIGVKCFDSKPDKIIAPRQQNLWVHSGSGKPPRV